jgi:hypothetical protein
MGPEHLAYKPDWPEARERFLALWEGEIVDRACISVTAPRDQQRPVPEPASWEAKYTDIDFIIAQTNARLSNTYFAGEAIPTGSNFLGYAAYGGEPEFREETIWVHPVIQDWTEPYCFDPENRWCRRFIEIIQALICDGHKPCKYLVDTGGMHTPMDGLLFLRGSQGLCLDIRDRPDPLEAALPELLRAYSWMLEVRHEGIPSDHGWACMGMWAPGRYSHSACDFSAMISPKHFRQYVLPTEEKVIRSLDYCVYHLDGPDCVRHLPALLEIEALDGIQWVRGAADRAAGSALNWVPLCRQIQNARKVVQIGVKYQEIEAFLRELDPRWLFIVTDAPSAEAADSLLENAKRWSCQGVFPAVQVGRQEAS